MFFSSGWVERYRRNERAVREILLLLAAEEAIRK